MPPIPIAAYPFLKEHTAAVSFEPPASPRRAYADESRYEYDANWDAPSTPIWSSKRSVSSRPQSPTRRRNSVVGVPSTPTTSPKKGTEKRPPSPSPKRRKSATAGSSSINEDTYDTTLSTLTRPTSLKRRSVVVEGTTSLYDRHDNWSKYDNANGNHNHDNGKIEFQPGRRSRSASLSSMKQSSPYSGSPTKAHVKQEEKETHHGSFNLGSLLQSLGEIRANLLSPRSPTKKAVTATARPSPVVPKSPSATKQPVKRDVGSAPRSPSQRRIVKGTPPNRTQNGKRPPVSPRKADKHRGPTTNSSSKRRAPSTPTKTSTMTSPERKRQFDKKRQVGFKSFPHQLPLTAEPSFEEEEKVEVVGILKQSSYPPGPILRRDGKVKKDQWISNDEEKERDVNEICDPSIAQKTHRNKTSKRSRSSSKKKKEKKNRNSQSVLDVEPPEPLYLPSSYLTHGNTDAEEVDDESVINFDFEVYQFLQRLDEYTDETTATDTSKSKSASMEQSDEYPVIDILPQEGDDNTVLTDSDDSSYEEVEVIEEEEVFGEEVNETVIDEEAKATVEEESADESCHACGLDCSCIPEEMVSCPRCRKAFYCSVDCMQWDYSSGDHLSVCHVATTK
eukprot:scaffold2357_cov167-Amphora_coffeaeformis.AAC.38